MIEKYQQSTPRSKEFWTRALRVFPGGVSHNIRTFGFDCCGAYPPFIKRADGSHIWDIDDNQYVDWWMTHFASILGHNHPKIREAIQQQLDYGVHFGIPNEYQVIFGEKLQKAIPYFKKLRFTATGSEATMYAARLARSFTSKHLVAKAKGGWHGGSDTLGYHLFYPYSDQQFFGGISFDFNNRESVDSMLNTHGKELAAIIIEPMLGAGGGIAPDSEFLPYLREETESRGILLIFDEIITGFRLSFGSAGKEIFGVEPDLLTLGKIIGGGMPLGIYGGREDIMKLATPGIEGGCWVGGGTFSSHPLSMIAGIVTLDELQLLKNEYLKLNQNGEKLRKEINDVLKDEKVLALATGMGSIIFIHWLKKELKNGAITGNMIAEALDHERMDYFQGKLLENGVFGFHGLGALSFNHSENDLNFTLEMVSKGVNELKRKNGLSS